MLVYGVPTIRDWENCYGGFFEYNTISGIAMSEGRYLGDYVVDALRDGGCDYLKKNRQALSETFSDYTLSVGDYSKLFRDILQALFQYFYAPVIDLETGYVQSLREIPNLEH